MDTQTLDTMIREKAQKEFREIINQAAKNAFSTVDLHLNHLGTPRRYSANSLKVPIRGYDGDPAKSIDVYIHNALTQIGNAIYEEYQAIVGDTAVELFLKRYEQFAQEIEELQANQGL